MYRFLTLCLLTVGLLLASGPSTANAQNARPISYQGMLTDGAGNPLTGTFDITISIYDTASGGAPYWSETHGSVAVSDGAFSVMLGSVTPIAIQVWDDEGSGHPLWLDVQIGVDSPISPRTQIGAVPFAAVTQRVNGDVETGPGSLTIGGDGLHGHLTILAANGDTTFKRDISNADMWGPLNLHGDVTIGGGGTDGHLTILNAAGDTTFKRNTGEVGMWGPTNLHGPLTIDGPGGGLAVLFPAGDTLLSARVPDSTLALKGNLVIGGGGVDGHLTILNAAGDTTFKRNTINAGMWGPLNLHGPLTLDGDGANGGVSIDTNGIAVYNASVSTIAKPGELELRTLGLGGAPYVNLNSDSGFILTKLGIGTTSPQVALEVADMARVGGHTWATSGTGLELAYREAEHRGYVQTYNRDTDSWGDLIVGGPYGSGRVGMGTESPSARLDVSSSSDALRLRAGNGFSQTTKNQILLSYNGGVNYAHAIKSRHQGSADAGNAIDFYVWDYGVDADSAIGSKHVMTLDGAGSGRVGIGTSSPNYTLDVRGSIGNNTTLYHSDLRWKTEIESIPDALEKVTALRGVQFKWRQEAFPEMAFPDGSHLGVIAQEVEKILPELVHNTPDGFKSVEYANLTAVLIEAVKEQQEQIKSQQEQIDQLKSLVNSLVSAGQTDMTLSKK